MSAELDRMLMALAAIAARESKDTGRQVGCVLADKDGAVIASGHNELPHGCEDTAERRCRPHKYKWTEHAERNAVFLAARQGSALEGCTAYTTCYPCADCARAFIQSGIARMVTPAPDFDDPRWGEDFRIVEGMLAEAGVAVSFVEVPG